MEVLKQEIRSSSGSSLRVVYAPAKNVAYYYFISKKGVSEAVFTVPIALVCAEVLMAWMEGEDKELVVPVRLGENTDYEIRFSRLETVGVHVFNRFSKTMYPEYSSGELELSDVDSFIKNIPLSVATLPATLDMFIEGEVDFVVHGDIDSITNETHFRSEHQNVHLLSTKREVSFFHKDKWTSIEGGTAKYSHISYTHPDLEGEDTIMAFTNEKGELQTLAANLSLLSETYPSHLTKQN